MDKKIIGLIIITLMAVVAISGCTSSDNSNTNSTQKNESNEGEKKAIDIFNNRNPTDDFKITIASGSLRLSGGSVFLEGSTFPYSLLGYPELEKADSATLTVYEGKKVYEIKVSPVKSNSHVVFQIYIDATTWEFIK